MYDIVSDMYEALEKHAKSDGKNAASYYIDENPILTEGSLQNTTGSKANRMKLASTRKGIENFLTGSLLEIRPRNDALDAAQYFYETTQYFTKEKENNKMEKRITSTVKTKAEINYDNAISEIDQHQAEDYDKIRKEADAARLAAKQELEIQTLREENRRIALDYRFFYEELIAAGFSEEEAWKILLNKQPGYMAPPYYSFSDI